MNGLKWKYTFMLMLNDVNVKTIYVTAITALSHYAKTSCSRHWLGPKARACRACPDLMFAMLPDTFHRPECIGCGGLDASWDPSAQGTPRLHVRNADRHLPWV